MNRRNWKPTLLMMGLLVASPWSTIVGFCPFSSPIAQADPMQQPSGTLVLPDPAAAVGGFFWELGHGDPADGLGNDADSTLSGFPVGPDDAPWIRRDLVPAGLDWDWFFYGTDGCLSGGSGTGVMVAYVLDNATDRPNYALLAVAGTTAPVPGHYFDDINTAGGSSGHFVLLQPLLLIPRVTQMTLVDPGTLSVDVAGAMASVNVHDDLAGSGPYPGLVDLTAVTALIHRLPGGGDETAVPGCVPSGCTGITLPVGRELCWEGSAMAVGHQVPGESICEGGVLDGFSCLPDNPDDGCAPLGGTCVTAPSVSVAMGPAIPGGCVELQSAEDADGDGFASTTDCDDTDPMVFPGAPQFCDDKNNDCLHPSWPDLPAAECFAIADLRVAHVDGEVSLNWSIPDSGSETYRIFRGTTADLTLQNNGGLLHASTTANTTQFADPLPLGDLAFYVVAGVRDSIQGSVGQDSLGQERSIALP